MRKSRIGSLYGIALCNLYHQSFKTTILFLLVFTMTVALCSSKLLLASMEAGIQKTCERIGADLIVVPDKYIDSMQNALFEGKACTVNFPKEWVERVREIEGIEAVSYQLFLATLTSGCCDGENQLIAMEPKSDFVVRAWLEKEGKTSLKNGEIIVGSALGKKEGETVHYYGREFQIKAVLEESGMGYDNSAFITYQDAYDIAADPMYAGTFPFSAEEESISSILIQVSDGYDSSKIEEKIRTAYEQDGIAVYTMGELTGELARQFKAYQIYGTWFEWIFVMMAAISIFAVYMVNISQRHREFACMSSIGFTFRQIMLMLLQELIINVLLAGIAGFALTGVLFGLFRLAIRNFVSIPFLLPDSRQFLLIGLCVIASNLLVSVGAYVYALLRLRNTEIALLVREVN